jgi:uncharacterized protein (TIGR02594 family)
MGKHHTHHSKFGSHNGATHDSNVAEQEALMALGYELEHGADGIKGKETREAIKEFLASEAYKEFKKPGMSRHAVLLAAGRNADPDTAHPEHHSKFSAPVISKAASDIGKQIIDIASDFLHYDEKNKKEANALSKFISTATNRHFDVKKTEWCAAMLNSVLATVGVKGTDSDGARSFLSFGTPVAKKDVQPGDIAVFSRTGKGTDAWSGHVGIVVAKHKNGTVDILAGNQGNKEEVSISTRSESKLLGYRRVSEKDIVSAAPSPPKANYAQLAMN